MESILNILSFAEPSMNALAKVIYWLVTITASVSVGVILFTLILKLITLPFDYLSRASMRKNNIIMESMRPELEKLQKQYADNKDLYNQKMMALYKKNGYSAFGACLPTILTLVIFIVAISAFNKYSQWQNKQYFYEMTCSYNSVVYDGLEIDDSYIVKNDKGELIIDLNKIKDVTDSSIQIQDKHQIFIGKEDTATDIIYSLTTTNGYVKYVAYYNKANASFGQGKYYLLHEKVIASESLKDANGKTYAEAKAENEELTPEAFFNGIRQDKSAQSFRNQNKKFLWVKNIWVSDTTTKSPIQSDWESFKAEQGIDDKDNLSSTFGEADYAELIAKLDVEKEEPNGYYILVALTIGLTFLSQFINGKVQKAQMELQTVDGQGAASQKMMMWMMPIMMAVFSFMYTAAFSIYIILNTALSLGTMFLINFIVDVKYKDLKNPEKKEIIRGRIYNKKEEENTQKPAKSKNKKEEEKIDFLSGLADKKVKTKKEKPTKKVEEKKSEEIKEEDKK